MNAEDKKQKRLCILLSLMLCFTALISSVVEILQTYVHIPYFNAGFLYIFYYGLLLVCCFDAAGRMSLSSFWGFSLVLLAYVITLMFFPDNQSFMWTSLLDLMSNPTYSFFLFAFAGFLVAPYLTDFEMFQNIFEKFAVVAVSALSLRYVWGRFLGDVLPEYMTFSYDLLLPTVFLMLRCILNFRWYRLLLSVMGSIIILIAGCRGALIGLIGSLILYVFFVGKIPFKNKNRAKLILIISALVILVFYNQILGFIARTLNSLGIGSRTIEMLLDASITSDSGRGIYQEILWNSLNIFGYGLWGDRALLHGHYAHNLFLEILCDFGILLGPIILIGLIYLLCRGFKRAGETKSLLLCALFSTGIVKLIFSGSFLNIEPSLYVLIGLCVNPHSNSLKKGN